MANWQWPWVATPGGYDYRMVVFRICLCLAVACLCARVCIADPEPPAADPDAPKAITPDELAAAEKTLTSLTAEQQLAVNNLRYLMRPAYEVELMAGRRFRPCTLPPFEDVPTTAMTTLEAVRLWAVLRSGMPITPASERQLARFIAMPLPAETKSLAPYALGMSVCWAAQSRPEFGHGDALKKKAEELANAAIEVRTATDEKSAYIVGQMIDPKWFTNHLWRAVTCRCALALDIKFNENIWEADLRNLAGAYERRRGWTSSKADDLRTDYDFCTNFVSIAALSLAAMAPKDAVTSGVLRTIDKRFKHVPDVLARLEKDYPFDRLDGAIFACANSFAPELAPGEKTPADWHAAILRSASAYEPTGAVKSRRSLTSNMELGASRFDRISVETALSIIGLSGGFVPGEGPLAKLELATIGRAMHAFTVLHAHNIPADSDGFDDLDPAAEEAIRMGCEHLEGIQESDGSFPGLNAGYSGNTALCLLAMLHGGWDRNSGPIKRGLEWLLDYDPGKMKRGGEVAGVGYGNTYSDAIVLMFLQKYYEREQIEHGVFWCNDKAEYEKARKAVWEKIDAKHRTLIDKMVEHINDAHVNTDQGGFGYYPGGVAAGGMAGASPTYSDNSCSQYAILGYKAASLLGAKLNTEKLRHEAKRLIAQYYAVETMDEVEFVRSEDDKKSTSKEWKSKIRPGGWGYIAGSKSSPAIQLTAAGVSSLVICQDELKLRGELDNELDRAIELTIHGAQTWMATAYYKGGEAGGLDLMLNAGGMDGWSVFYNLYSVERACVLAGLKVLGKDVDWYEIGAEALIEHQNPEGNWGPENMAVPQTVNDCLAILFLKKASMPVITDPRRRQPQPDPITPDPDKPKDPVTGDKPKDPETGK
jgi:hypothetical protein